MSKATLHIMTIGVVFGAVAVLGQPAAAEIAIDQNSLKPFEAQIPDVGKLNRARTAGASIIVSHGDARQ